MNVLATPEDADPAEPAEPVRRRIDVTDLRTESVADIARRRAREGPVTFERRGGSTYLLTEKQY
ncbi:hypothetical protein [Haloarchaeobius sp. DFWS5]|uniref:hypothetical protein n=1 Tax=Haloarchaeobius sp. DFWS5 TaxID=3446114 RepID=UPI003EB6FC09